MSTHREIEEVYLSDIIRIQKMTKSIVAESLGDINKMGEEMKYCCDRMKQAIENDELRDCGGRWWYSDLSMWVNECPFCTRCPYCERKYEKKKKSGK